MFICKNDINGQKGQRTEQRVKNRESACREILGHLQKTVLA